jgi:hypothetical protein
MWGQHQASQWHLKVPPGVRPVQAVKDFDKRVVRSQPLIYLRAIATDLARGFAPARTYDVPGYPSSYWLFQDHYWSADTFPGLREKIASGRVGAVADNRTAATAMAAYGRWVFSPGPVMALLLFVCVAATLGVRRARCSGDRTAVGLLLAACVVPLLTTSALSGFSWRYQLPQVALLPTAAALAVSAMVIGRSPGRPDPFPPLQLLDRAAAGLSRLPIRQGWRPTLDRAVARGWCQVVLGVLIAVAVGSVLALLAAASGWFTGGTAAVLGSIVAAGVLVTLLVARKRSGAAVDPPAPRST